jgi:cytosine/adenosine deaminase-related metal-dependent hydrolase
MAMASAVNVNSQYHSTIANSNSSVVLSGARLALGADEGIRADLEVTEGHISSIEARRFSAAAVTETGKAPMIDLTGYLVLPGLINAHDHLEFGLYPNLGHGSYASSAQWASDIHRKDSVIIEQHRRVPKDVRLWWGAVRNLLCGVTTVCQHNPLDREIMSSSLPIRVLSRFGGAHSINMDPKLASEFSSTPSDVPFILHLGEGVDDGSADEIFQLDRMHALDQRTVLVNGLALGKRGMNLVNRRGASLVWCPSSNYFLFGRTHTPATIASADRIVLGSDSPLTASGDLLDEIHFACFRVGIEARELYRQVTSGPSQVFRMENGEGSVIPGAAADLIAVRDLRETPATTLSQLSYKDIELVLVGGRVQLASETVRRRLPEELTSGLKPLCIEKTLRWVRAPLGRMFGEAERILGCGVRLGGKRVSDVATVWP